MHRILFTHSYFLRFDPKELRAMMPYPPLGTLYAAAVARERGDVVSLFDAMLAEGTEELEPMLERERPEILVIYDDDFNYLTKMCLTRMREAAFAMLAMARRRGIITIVHGSDATDHVERYFEAGADYILAGEAEQTLVELLDRLEQERSPEGIAGLVHRTDDGTIVRGPKRNVLRDLDALPLPARDLVDIDRYRRAWRKHHGYFSLNVATTRGCPFHCNWCAKPLYGQVYNVRSPHAVAEEFRQIKELWSPDHIWICDDIFGLKPGWVQEFSREVVALDAAIPFKCLSRADLINRDGVAHALVRAGCSTVWIGAESGSQKILDAMEKGITVEQIHRATVRLRSLGIRVGFFLQMGYPGEGEGELMETFEMVRRALPDEIGISVSYPLPGTPFYERVRAEMGEKRNWSESADLAMMFQGTFGTSFYRTAQRWMHMHHRKLQGARALKRLLTGEVRRMSREERRRALLLPYYAVRRRVLAARAGRIVGGIVR